MATKTRLYRLGIDCRLAGIQHAGIGRYTANLVTELIKLNQDQPQLTLILFFFDRNQAKAVLGDTIYQHQKRYHLQVMTTPIKHYSLKEQLELPKIYKAANLDLLHVPHFNIPIFYRGALVITIHDLLWHQQKGKGMTTLNPLVYYLKYLAYLYIVKRAVCQAQQIFVPAQVIKQTIIKYYPKVAAKIIITPEGIAKSYQQASQNLLKQATKIRHWKVKRQLVYTGSLYPHKNLAIVIKTLVKLPKYKLLIVGSRNVFQNQVRNLVARYKVKKQVQFLGYVDDDKLIKLYQQSLALIQPSLSEGFGLTGVEAMASATAVLASDIPIFHEIYQDRAIYFDPRDCQSLLAALERLKFADRYNLIRGNLQFVQRYSWEKLAQQTLEAYQPILKQSSYVS